MSGTESSRLSFHHHLYLHFLDRELAKSVEFTPSARMVWDSICCLIVSSPAPLYCGLSPAWETSYRLGTVPALLARLAQTSHLLLLSSHPTQDEFLAARIAAYQHDSARYPMYFHESHFGVSDLKPTLPKTGSTTKSLQSGLRRWSADPPDSLADKIGDVDLRRALLSSVASTLDSDQDRAVTLALFKERLAHLGSCPKVLGVLSREISSQYTEHYLKSESGEIPTGIVGLSEFDSISKTFPLYDIPILMLLLQGVGANMLVGTKQFEVFLAVRGQETHLLFADRLRVLIAGMCRQLRLSLPCRATHANRERIRQFATRLLNRKTNSSPSPSSVEDLLFSAITQLDHLIREGSKNPEFARGVLEMEQVINHTQHTTILLAVAADVEHDAVKNAAIKEGLPQFKRRFEGDHTYWQLGQLGGCELLLVKCTAGSGGVSGALPTLMDAANDVKPNAIIMPGIAFGLKQDKQELCEILLSKQIMAYDLKRYTEDEDGTIKITPRGDRVSASPRLHDRFWNGARDWRVAKVHEGLILSGDTLVDSPKFKSELLRLEPEAIGGEMEAAGLYVASMKHHIDWIVVKAICDWGENKDKSVQPQAAENAASLVFHVIKQGGIRI